MDPAIFEMGVPVLGICYGCQLMAHTLGGRVTAAQDDSAREYGKTETYYDTSCKLFQGLPGRGHLLDEPQGLYGKGARGTLLWWPIPTTAPTWPSRTRSGASPACSYHPEVNHSENGVKMIRNFLYEGVRCGGRLDHGRL